MMTTGRLERSLLGQRPLAGGRWVAALALAASLASGPTAAVETGPPAPVLAASAQSFRAFVESFRTVAEGAGIKGAFYDATFAGMTPDTTVAAMTVRQPEFSKPVGAYLATQVTNARVAAGRDLKHRWGKDLAAIQRRYGVPAAIIVAVWGLETNYGVAAGSKDVIRSLATLAATNYRPDLYRAELLAALTLLQAGDVPRQNLRGSWAGAMGQPQFMPSSFQKFAVDWDGDGRKDIWSSVPDSLASIANFLAMQGWQADRPWGFAVEVPPGFDLKTSQGDAQAWAGRGFVRSDSAPLPTTGDFVLFFPAGASGPAFLVSPNFEVLKTYNFSDAYVLSIAALADRMEGAPPLALSWPTDAPMGRDHRIALQTRLVALGYAVDNREGRISLALRDTIRRAQASVGMVVDGNPTDALLTALPVH